MYYGRASDENRIVDDSDACWFPMALPVKRVAMEDECTPCCELKDQSMRRADVLKDPVEHF